MINDDARPQPLAAWPWRRPAGRPLRTPPRPSVDPELEALERDVGLTAAVARRWAEHVPAILGPLRHERLLRPLSLEGGRLRAVALARVPDVADWQVSTDHVPWSRPQAS
jgi:hypothetical protein